MYSVKLDMMNDGVLVYSIASVMKGSKSENKYSNPAEGAYIWPNVHRWDYKCFQSIFDV